MLDILFLMFYYYISYEISKEKKMNNALESLEFKALNLINTNKFPMWLIEDHKCPRCNGYVKDHTGIMFLLEQGYCLGCDHVDSEYYAERATYGVELNYGDYGEGL